MWRVLQQRFQSYFRLEPDFFEETMLLAEYSSSFFFHKYVGTFYFTNVYFEVRRLFVD
jgi:hypothetical protein